MIVQTLGALCRIYNAAMFSEKSVNQMFVFRSCLFSNQTVFGMQVGLKIVNTGSNLKN